MDIKLKVVKKIEAYFIKAEDNFGRQIERPKVSFDIRGQDAGRAYFPIKQFYPMRYIQGKKKISQSEIKFNEVLLEQNPQEFLDNIVAHECAHLIVHEVFGTKAKPHGREWKSIMKGLFSADASVRHNLDVSTIVNKPYIYSCQCQSNKGGENLGGGVALSNRQHQSVKKGAVYLCQKCKGELLFSYEKDLSITDKSQVGIAGLYVFIEDGFPLDEDLLVRWIKILNKNRPDKIYTSIDLSSNELFLPWLRKNKMLRKYQGKLSQANFSGKFYKKEISHCMLMTSGLDESEELFWSVLVKDGLFLRTVKR